MADEEYDTDPDESKPSLSMRRRQASDDENEESDMDGEKSTPSLLTRRDSRIRIGSDVESDGQGGVGKYEDVSDTEAGEVEEDEDDYGEVDNEGFIERVDAVYRNDGVHVGAEVGENVEELGREIFVEDELAEDDGAEQCEEENGKKQNEPFAVPTGGSFYMHDDRLKGMHPGGSKRQTLVQNKLWESKDDRKWGHDKFEEMAIRERRYEEAIFYPKSQYQTGGRNRGSQTGYVRGGKPRVRANSQTPENAVKYFRGRGPIRYEPLSKVRESRKVVQTPNRRPGKTPGKYFQTNSYRFPTSVSNGYPDPLSSSSQVFASSLNSASPPFYPSGSSNKEDTLPHEKAVQADATYKNPRFQVMDERYSMSQSTAMPRANNISETEGIEKLYLNDSPTQRPGKPSTNYLPRLGSSINNVAQNSQPKYQRKGLSNPGQMSLPPDPSKSQVGRSPATRMLASQQSDARIQGQPFLQAPAQSSVHHSGRGSQSSSPPRTSISVSSFETESTQESSKSRNALVGNGGGSFLFNGASGKMGAGPGDQNFPSTPTFLPVMQFGGKHPGGIGVPAVGMAFPGYVAQPQLGLGKSEMTWLPVLAGAASALGANYCSPYMAVDGPFQPRPTGQTSSVGPSSEESSGKKSNSDWKPSQKPEPLSEELEQRPNKPRRYSEMSFGQ